MTNPLPKLIAFADGPIHARDELSARFLQHMPIFDAYKRHTAREQGVAIAKALAETPEGRRAVFPFYILGYQLKVSEYPVDAAAIFERGEIDVSKDVESCGHLGAELARRGIELDLIYCDAESDLTPWTLGMEKIIEVYKNDKARANLPPELQGYDAAKIKMLSPEFHEWIPKFSINADRIRSEALRKVLVDSGLMSPWGERTIAVNFYTLRTSFTIHDYNGWPYRRLTLLDARTSCPVCMFGPQGQRYDKREHHRYWNNFIDLINHARSGAATGGIVPVIREAPRDKDNHIAGTVDPGGRWLLDHLIGHLVRAGASRFMYFHPAATAADDRALAEIMQKHEAALPDKNPALPEIALEVDEVVTGEWKTTYADFLAQKPDRWPAIT